MGRTLNQRVLAYLALFGGILAMGFSPIFVTLAHVNGLAVTLYRTSIATSVLLVPFLLPRANRLGTATTRPSLRMTIAIASLGGLLFAANNVLFNTAVTMIPASTAVFLVYTAVIWIGLFSIVIYHEKLSLNFWVGVFLALAGVFLITGRRGGSSGNFLYNGNAEIFSDGLAGQTFTFLKGAAFYQLHTKKMPGRTSLGAELNLQMSPSPSSTNLFLGARWEPKSSVLIDVGVATSAGGTTTFATPAFIRLNLKL